MDFMITRQVFNRLAIASAIFALSGGALMAQDYPQKIRIGDVGFGFGTPFGRGITAIADAKGFIAAEFKGKPTKIEFIYFVNTGPAINEAFGNNQLEFASYGAVPNTIGRANGLQTRILSSYGSTTIFAGVKAGLP